MSVLGEGVTLDTGDTGHTVPASRGLSLWGGKELSRRGHAPSQGTPRSDLSEHFAAKRNELDGWGEQEDRGAGLDRGGETVRLRGASRRQGGWQCERWQGLRKGQQQGRWAGGDSHSESTRRR